MKPLSTILLFLFLAPGADAAQATLSSSASTVTIGERVELRVVVRTEPGTRAVRLQVPPGAYEVIGRRSLPATGSADVRTFVEIVTVAFFQTGDFTIGPFQVDLLPAGPGPAGREPEPTGQLVIRVRSLLGENDKDIRPLKELLAMRGDPRHLLPFAAALLLLLLLAGLIALLLRRARRKRAPEAAPPPPPELELEARLRELRRQDLPARGEFRPFFIALSAMLKHFIQRAYGFNAEDCTTSETMALLQGRENDGAIVSHLDAVLTQADLVKFARRLPGSEELAAIWPKLASLIAVHRARREQALEAAHVQVRR
ncbi:MAG: BatD family protein [Acidobacteria bacterium]|jgi:hypothetical protein|nr:BatD family protein [Acidobacteriota bacterium]